MSPRPAVGPAILIRLTDDLLDEIDRRAEQAGVARAAMIRQLLTQALEKDQP